jgi:hypothetical protein
MQEKEEIPIECSSIRVSIGAHLIDGLLPPCALQMCTLLGSKCH